MMKKLSIWCVMIFTLLLVFISCEEIEKIEPCPKITMNIDNVSGSAVYHFTAQLDSIADVRLSWSIDGEVIDRGNLNDIGSQVLDYKFETGKHTVCVKIDSDACPLEVCKEIDVIEDETNSGDGTCPELFFVAEQDGDNPTLYYFDVDFEGADKVGTLNWFVDENFVKVEDLNNGRFYYEFSEARSYEVCLVSGGDIECDPASYCKTIEINPDDISGGNIGCPELSIEARQDTNNPRAYYFYPGANAIEDLDNAILEWSKNGQSMGVSFGGKDPLYYEFEPGTYFVCLSVKTPDCPVGETFCIDKIVIDGPDVSCPELLFDKEQDGNKPAYYFDVVDLPGLDQLKLGWYINGKFIEDANTGNNNRFYSEFTPGRHEVCLKSAGTPECPEGGSYCRIIHIGGFEEACPELSFKLEQDGNTSGYLFYPDIVQPGIYMDNLTPSWLVNGEQVGYSSGPKDPFYYKFSPGTYEVCMSLKTRECLKEVTYCKTLVVN